MMRRAVPRPRGPKPLCPISPPSRCCRFQNMSGDPEQEYFADGIVEDIITALSRFKSLFVIARNSSFTYKGKAVDIKQVGRELGVRYVLEGSVRKSAGRVRITGQLIDSATGAHVWADRFDGKLEDVFELQDQVTTSVVGAVDDACADALRLNGLIESRPQTWTPTTAIGGVSRNSGSSLGLVSTLPSPISSKPSNWTRTSLWLMPTRE